MLTRAMHSATVVLDRSLKWDPTSQTRHKNRWESFHHRSAVLLHNPPLHVAKRSYQARYEPRASSRQVVFSTSSILDHADFPTQEPMYLRICSTLRTASTVYSECVYSELARFHESKKFICRPQTYPPLIKGVLRNRILSCLCEQTFPQNRLRLILLVRLLGGIEDAFTHGCPLSNRSIHSPIPIIHLHIPSPNLWFSSNIVSLFFWSRDACLRNTLQHTATHCNTL